MYIKDVIKKYVLFKIDAGHFGIGQKIFSENQLALKFKCSRQSARAALIELKNEFIIKPHQGSGYVVIDQFASNNLKPFGISNQISKTRIIQIPKIPLEIMKIFKLKSTKYLNWFIKEFYQNDHLIAVQFMILNKDRIWNLDYEKMKNSVTQELANQGAPITEANFQISFHEVAILKPYLKSLGWKETPLIIKVKSLSNNFWIEKSLRLEKKEHINITFNKKRFHNF